MDADKSVLFSAVGTHDPIANYHDGPILHICRMYRPEKIYLYYSKDMYQNKLTDDRYDHAIKDLYIKKLGLQPCEITDYIDEDMIEVHRNDEFIHRFSDILTGIHEENPSSKIIVNISSGTPAMKSTLLLLSVTLPFKVVPIQVSVPVKEINKSPEYDTDYTELNEDNKTGVKNRCYTEEYRNVRAEITKENISSHIDAFDYEAALREAKTIRDFITDYTVDLLHAATERMRMNVTPLQKKLKPENRTVIRQLPGDVMPIFEYALWLKLKYERNDVSDFIRGFTPGFFKLSHRYLLKFFDIDQYLRNNWLRRETLQNDIKGQKCLEILDGKYGKYKDSLISSDICVELISNYSDDITLIDKFIKLRNFENTIRNRVAHEIIRIDAEQIKTIAGSKLEAIWALFQSTLNSVLNISCDDWNSYNKMNEIIRKEMKKPF